MAVLLPRDAAFSLEEWEDAVSFLLGCQVRFENYREVNQSLKPFSLEVR